MSQQKVETIQFSDLSGDPCYDFLKTQVLPGFKILGGRIHEKQIVQPKEPRKLIEIELFNEKTMRSVVIPYNYKKIERDHLR